MRRVELEVRAADGRRLMVDLLGPEDGEALFLLHGTPGVRDLDAHFVEEGARRGVRHVLYSRPGYEGSDRLPGRSIADCVPDVAAVADAIGVDRFFVVGESGGGQHALAVAALLPERVRAVAAIACSAPFGAEGLDWLDGHGDGNLAEHAELLKGDDALRQYIEAELEELRSVRTKSHLLAMLDKHLCAADRAVLASEFGDSVLANWIRIGAADVIWGWLDDDKAHVRDWGFDLSRIGVPVRIWHGGEDRFVPLAHGKWLADRIPGAESRFFPSEGHVSLFRRYPQILDDLIASSS